MIKTLLARLKSHNPKRVRAYNSDDETRDIAVPERRRKWASVIEALNARPWSHAELLDKSGAILATVQNDEPAGELEELTPSTGRAGDPIVQAERIAVLVQRSVTAALSHREREHETLLRAQSEVVREMVAGMRSLAGLYREQLAVERDVSAARIAGLASEDKDQVTQVIEALPMLVQLLPMAKQLLGGQGPGPAPSPINGARKS